MKCPDNHDLSRRHPSESLGNENGTNQSRDSLARGQEPSGECPGGEERFCVKNKHSNQGHHLPSNGKPEDKNREMNMGCLPDKTIQMRILKKLPTLRTYFVIIVINAAMVATPREKLMPRISKGGF